jgi:signal transduction histidine kinase
MDPTPPAPAELSRRAEPDALKLLAGIFTGAPMLGDLLDAVPEFYMVLTRTRQIVFANKMLREHVRRGGVQSVLGLRPGEALGCAHSCKTPGGCGASEFCLDCGALSAILAGQRGAPAVEECRLTLSLTGEALDLRVFSTPLRYENELFVALAAMDISAEKRRAALEHAFFQDNGNSVAIISGSAELLCQKEPDSKIAPSLLRAAHKLLGDFEAQRDLASAERGELTAYPTPLHTHALLQELAAYYGEQRWTAGRRVVISEGSADVEMVNDRTLLGRVLGSMLKNALEACRPQETATLRCFCADGQVEFQVHNPGPMPLDVQHQVFQRSFTTKGPGRGLGTYGMKMLAERYLQGRVGFESSPEGGTTFSARFPQTVAD